MSLERARRYRELVKLAARQFHCKPSSEKAKHVATLRLARETFADRLVAGRDVNPEHLLKLDGALKEYLPQATSVGERHKLTLEIVNGTHTQCPKCGHEYNPYDPDKPYTPPDDPMPPPLRGVPAPVPPNVAAPKSDAPKAANVVPLPSKPRSIHDGAPLKT